MGISSRSQEGAVFSEEQAQLQFDVSWRVKDLNNLLQYIYKIDFSCVFRGKFSNELESRNNFDWAFPQDLSNMLKYIYRNDVSWAFRGKFSNELESRNNFD